MKTNYIKQAEDFLKSTNVKFSADFIKFGKYFPSDTQERAIFRITLQRNGKKYSFRFGQSIVNRATTPDAYSVLACLQKYDVGSFVDFCGEFGYNIDSSQAEKTYKAVCKEFEMICKIWNEEERELLNEIN